MIPLASKRTLGLAFRSKQAPFPFIREITVDAIAHAGDKLWKELLGNGGPKAPSLKITNVQLSFTGIESMETGQRQIEGFFQKPQSTDRGNAPLSVMSPTKGIHESERVSRPSAKRKRCSPELEDIELTVLDPLDDQESSRYGAGVSLPKIQFARR